MSVVCTVKLKQVAVFRLENRDCNALHCKLIKWLEYTKVEEYYIYVCVISWSKFSSLF